MVMMRRFDETVAVSVDGFGVINHFSLRYKAPTTDSNERRAWHHIGQHSFMYVGLQPIPNSLNFERNPERVQ